MLFITAFLAAPVTLYLVYVISPYAQAFYIAMTDWRGVTASPGFIGLDNFAGSSPTGSSGRRSLTTCACSCCCRW